MKLLARTILVSLLPLLYATPAAAAPKAAPQESLVELLPARARLAAIVRRNALGAFRELLLSDAEMMRELQPYLERSLGIDLTRLEGLALFTMDVAQKEPKLGVLLRIPSGGGALKLKAAGDAGGTPLYRLERDVFVARVKAGLVVGHEAEVRAAVAVDRGREAAMPRDAGLGKLLSTDANDVDLVVALGPGALMQAASMGIEDGLLTLRRGGLFELAVHGDPIKLAGLRAMAQAGMQSALQTLAQEKDKATATNEPVRGTTAIMLYHRGKKFLTEVEPKLDGNTLSVRYQWPELGSLGQPAGMLALAGIASAIAIPAFTKFQARSKTTEARMMLGKIAGAVVSWSEFEGHKPQQLKSTDWSPQARCCGQAEDRCAPDTKAFAHPTWKALGVSVDEASRYQYRVMVEPKAKPARIVVEARGDLDCDGEYSSYKRVVTFGQDGIATIGEVETTNELE